MSGATACSSFRSDDRVDGIDGEARRAGEASPKAERAFSIGGGVEAGFEEVRAEFVRNFDARGEIGAACAVWFRGRPVVDLWGGWSDPVARTPWQRDTVVMVYSTTKGMTAMCFAVAHARGLFAWDDRVADHWPAFAAEGKGAITVRDLLSHRAGLSAVDTRVDAALVADHDALAAMLARQRPHWEPGTRIGYHAITFGWYANALLRHIDPQRRTLGRFFQEEIAARLGITFHIGFPEALAPRLARIVDFHPIEALFRPREVPWRLAAQLLLAPRSLPARALRNPRVSKPSEFSGPVLRAIELPSTNGIGEVRAVAQVYGEAAIGGAALALDARTLGAITAMPAPPPGGFRCAVLGDEACFHLGFVKPTPSFPFGGSDAFGAPGLGGSFGFAEPSLSLGFCYAPNRLGMRPRNDARERALREAARRCAAQIVRD